MKKFSPFASRLVASALLVLVASSSNSFAQQSCQQCQSVTLSQRFRGGYDANVQWPRIYIPPARRSVCATYDAMVNNGWRRQNLLGNYHFNSDTDELTSAGKLKVNWILSQAPVQRRNIFVQRGAKEIETTARLAAVHAYAGSLSPGVGQVDVNDTHSVAEGHRASSVDKVFVGYDANRLPPVLPSSTSGGSSEQQ
jgi:hypothetical protein